MLFKKILWNTYDSTAFQKPSNCNQDSKAVLRRVQYTLDKDFMMTSYILHPVFSMLVIFQNKRTQKTQYVTLKTERLFKLSNNWTQTLDLWSYLHLHLNLLQRDLDFTIDLDFKGQLCEASVSNDYKMR